MKRTLLFGLIALMTFSGFAQIRIIEHGVLEGGVIVEPGGDVDLSGTTITQDFATDGIDHVVDIWVENMSETETYTLRCRRLETDVVAGSENNVCWDLCPISTLLAGEDPDWTVATGTTIREEILAPGEIATSFAFHYEPNFTVGISTFEVRFVDGADEDLTYASFNISFDHDGIVGIEEVENVPSFTMIPNPANEIVALDFANLTGDVQLKVFNVLGEVLIERSNVQTGQNFRLETSELQSGIYMVSVLQDNNIVNTSRLMVKH
ncbi:MAG: hypothetical protein ACI8XB_001687 [Patiriisocius sp.]|jgi:hypothetical protein